MKRIAFLGLLLGILTDGSLLAATSFDLTPRPAVAAGDGMEQPVITFQKGKGCVVMLLPNKWKASGGATSITFTKDDAAQASVKMAIITKPIPLDGKNAQEALKQTLLATVPKDAIDIKVISEGQDALGVNGWKSVDLEITFNFYGNVVHRFMSFWSQAPDSQFQVLITSYDRDYEKISKEGMYFLRSWSELPADQLSTLKFR